MNILFVNNSEINPLNSGIQRITFTLAQAFTNLGIKCYGANFELHTPISNLLFLDTIKLGFSPLYSQKLSEFIDKYHIDRIIVQECFPLKKLKIVHKALKNNERCLLFYCNHSIPGKEFIRPKQAIEWFRLVHCTNKAKSLSKFIISLLPPIVYNTIMERIVHKNYSLIYKYSDKIVLLSQHYIPLFEKYSGIKNIDPTHFTGIGNSLSFPENLPKEEFTQKEKVVLIVGRLSDRAKRISSALKIWKEIETDNAFKDWTLKIIGYGPDEQYYKHLALKLKLKQIKFEGKRNPLPFYKQASICMLTSAYEGFGIVLTEAQQMGCIPVVFDTYEAVHDIIDHGKNGFIIPPNDSNQFILTLKSLMNDKQKREGIAVQAQIKCQQFSPKNIIHEWISTLDIHGQYGSLLQRL